ncbi:MAG: hypothetical protein FWF54_01340 [Candidatus Azobacteroides sp.]|nr:hypothetical protein [Candidatus Azobacteroides sp.]
MIKLTDHIQWDNALPLERQSEEVRQWFFETVYSKLCFDKRNLTDKNIEPAWDKLNRPVKWIFENEILFVEIERVYKNLYDWAMDRDIVTIKEKEV